MISTKEWRGKEGTEDNAFAEAALLGAYNDSEAWLVEVNQYIDKNLDYL